MPLQVEIPWQGDLYVDRIRITNDHSFIFPVDEDITAGDLLNAVEYHRDHFEPELKNKYKYYVGKHPILDQPKKAKHKPDNRILINFPRKAVTSFNGFFIGTPIKIDSKDKKTDEWVAAWQKQVNFEDVSSEVSKMSSMYGRAYFMVYQDADLDQDGNNRTLLAGLSPRDTFLIYDDTYSRKVKYAVIYRYNADHELEITLIDKNYKRVFTANSTNNNYLDATVAYVNPYPIVPIIEAPENEERLALCQDIFNLVDAQNKAMSEKANTVDYFDDTYMKIQNAHLDSKAIEKMHDNRVINVKGEGAGEATVEFMAKPDADATAEHLIDRLVDYMYQMTNITNLNDDSFSGDVTGVALQLKFQAMSDMARTKSLKFMSTLRDVFECVLYVNGEVSKSSIDDFEFKFTQNIPHNMTEEANFLATLYGKVPTKTLYAQLSFIKDPDTAYEELLEEQRTMAGQTSAILDNATKTNEKTETGSDKGGVIIDNNEAGKKPNNGTNATR